MHNCGNGRGPREKTFLHGKQTSGVKMVISCCAIGCKSRKNKNSSLSFHRFPRKQGRRNKWIAALGRIKWQPNEYSYLCSAHFAGGKNPMMWIHLHTILCYSRAHPKKLEKKSFKILLDMKEQRKEELGEDLITT